MISEREQILRKEKLTDADRKRLVELKPKSASKPQNKQIKGTTPLWMAIDKVHAKFVGKIEPWTLVKCTECKSEYHLVNGAVCECGKEESKERFNYHLGEMSNGTI